MQPASANAPTPNLQAFAVGKVGDSVGDDYPIVELGNRRNLAAVKRQFAGAPAQTLTLPFPDTMIGRWKPPTASTF